jgi:FHS family glucose/mannose:H+ symporter-like MFS transporter
MKDILLASNSPASVAHPATATEKSWWRSGLPLYIGFAATGICCALPGALLPSLLLRWRLDDRHGGQLFFVFWMGASLGALMVQRSLRRSIATGCLLIVGATWVLAMVGGRLASPLMFLFGLGLGVTMTSMSLLRQQEKPHARSVELLRLNLMWALGACASPVLMTHALRVGDPRTVLLAAGGFFALFCLWVVGGVSGAARLDGGGRFSLPSWRVFGKVPLSLVAMTMLATGIEASGGAWLATYAQRAEHVLALTIAAPTLLWAGLLCSRLVGSLMGAEELSWRRAPAMMLLVAIATVLLVTQVHGAALLGTSFLLGFGLGPLYPILLARTMMFYQGGEIFFLAGVSSAVMPWLTGAMSKRYVSLHAGLVVPAAGAVALLLLGLRSRLRDSKADAAVS